MDSLTLYDISLAIVIIYSALGWLVLTGIKINYGRLKDSISSIYFNPKIGWFLFQVPNLFWAFYFLFVRQAPLGLAYSLFIIHYINRDIIYPLRLKTTTQVPLQILLSAFSFTFANGYLQSIANQQQQNHSLLRQIIGVTIFLIGMTINIYSDNILQAAKQKISNNSDKGEKKYVRIDQFLFKYIANPNYFGEIIEWVGYSIVSGHFCSYLFVFSTINVLTPAAIVRNNWNKKNITNYPPSRKAILPGLI